MLLSGNLLHGHEVNTSFFFPERQRQRSKIKEVKSFVAQVELQFYFVLSLFFTYTAINKNGNLMLFFRQTFNLENDD